MKRLYQLAPVFISLFYFSQLCSEQIISEEIANLELSNSRSTSIKLTSHIPEVKLQYDNEAPVWSPDGTKIAFRGERNGNADIYIINSDGSELRRLTIHDSVDSTPTWSPDSKQILFSSMRIKPRQLFLISVDGTNLRQLTDNPFDSLFPDWSPDGNKIVFNFGSRSGETARQIYVIDKNGNNLRRLTNETAHSDYASWTPDGLGILFESDRTGEWRAFLMDSDGKNPRMLTDTHVTGPRMSSDGNAIVFQSDREDDILSIYKMNSDGSRTERLTHGPDESGRPDWSPDGKAIVFDTEINGVKEICTMEIATRKVTVLTGRQ